MNNKKATILRSGIQIPAQLIVDKYGLNGLTKIASKYVIKYLPHVGIAKSLNVVKKYKIDDEFYILLPRGVLSNIIKHGIISIGDISNATAMIPTTTMPKTKGNSNINDGIVDIAPPYKINALIEANHMPLYENQSIVANHLFSNYYKDIRVNNRVANVNLKMPAGSGKTRLGLGLAKLIGVKTLIVVPTEYLLQQWRDEIIDMFLLADLDDAPVAKSKGKNNKKSKQNTDVGAGAESLVDTAAQQTITIGMYSGKEKCDGTIVIGIINSLLKAPESFFKEFGFTIFDESHDYCSDTFSEIFWKAQSCYNLSLTATPDERKDGFDKALVYHFGSIIDVKDIPGYKTGDDCLFTGAVEVLRYHGHDNYTKIITNEKTGLLSVPHMVGQIVKDPYRNALIINKIKELYKQKRHIYVFTDQRAHINILKEMLDAQNIDADIDCGDGDGDRVDGDDGVIDEVKDNVVNDVIEDIADEQGRDDTPAGCLNASSPANHHTLMGGTKKEQMEEAKESSDRSVIFTTYGYSYRGVSIKHMDTMIIATPRASKFTQIIGRIKRKGADTSIKRKIIDIVDASTPLKNQFYERKKSYIKENFAVSTKNVAWNDIAIDTAVKK